VKRETTSSPGFTSAHLSNRSAICMRGAFCYSNVIHNKATSLSGDAHIGLSVVFHNHRTSLCLAPLLPPDVPTSTLSVVFSAEPLETHFELGGDCQFASQRPKPVNSVAAGHHSGGHLGFSCRSSQLQLLRLPSSLTHTLQLSVSRDRRGSAKGPSPFARSVARLRVACRSPTAT